MVAFFLLFMAAFPFIVLCSLGDDVAARKKIIGITRSCFSFWLWIIGMQLKAIGEKPVGRYIYVANHTSYIDTINIVPAIDSHFRVLGKAGMTKIPFYGFLYKKIVILVERKSANSRAISMKQMWLQIKKEGSVFIFPEGTFNETKMPMKEFYNGAFRLAIKTQTPISPIVFPDAADRWHYSSWLKLWPGRNRAIYLDPIPVYGLTKKDVPMLQQKVYSLMEDALIKHKK